MLRHVDVVEIEDAGGVRPALVELMGVVEAVERVEDVEQVEAAERVEGWS
jgi:hypothetical protein